MAISGSNLSTALIVAAGAFFTDQASKFAITHVMALEQGTGYTVIPGILAFWHTQNPGINFGLFPSIAKYALIALSVAVSLWLLIWAARRWRDGVFSLAVGLIIGGALGNAIDRLLNGAVTDFLNVSCCGYNNPFAFNVADVWIFLGVAILLLRTAKDEKHTA